MNKEIKIRQCVEFVPETPDYGIAELTVCLQYQNGKLAEIWITPEHENIKGKVAEPTNWVVRPYPYKDGSEVFFFDIVNKPNVFQYVWCNQHQTLAFRMYPPKCTQYWYIDRFMVGIVMYFTIENKAR